MFYLWHAHIVGTSKKDIKDTKKDNKEVKDIKKDSKEVKDIKRDNKEIEIIADEGSEQYDPAEPTEEEMEAETEKVGCKFVSFKNIAIITLVFWNINVKCIL